METLTTTAALRERIRAQRAQGQRIAFVPTMGNLHAGHLQLVRHAKTMAECVVVSIFVNPMQFGPNEDFASYPRTRDADRAVLQDEAADLLFMPDVQEIYAGGDVGQVTRVEVPGFEGDLCGQFRPGFFTGIATVVTGLFNRVQPDCAVFGEKDYQQLVMIKRMVRDLCMPIEVHGVATMREVDGLAMSSRNGYLDVDQRARAVRLYQVLEEKAGLEAGRRDIDALEQQAMGSLAEAGFKPDYVSIREQDSLKVPNPQATQQIVLAAATLGTTRLIDNIKISIA